MWLLCSAVLTCLIELMYHEAEICIFFCQNYIVWLKMSNIRVRKSMLCCNRNIWAMLWKKYLQKWSAKTSDGTAYSHSLINFLTVHIRHLSICPGISKEHTLRILILILGCICCSESSLSTYAWRVFFRDIANFEYGHKKTCCMPCAATDSDYKSRDLVLN